MTNTLLAHVVAKFTPRQWENVATEALRFLLERNAGDAPARVARPFVDLPAGLVWRPQAAEVDTGIPDLVGEDARRRPVVMVEGKFWAQLTRHQPSAYLARQAAALTLTREPGAGGFPTTGTGGNAVASRHQHVLMFLVPAQRQALIAHELAERMGCASTLDEATGLHVLDNGQLVLVVSWARMLAEVRTCLAEADDQEGLENLEQLAGLCDRADREAMLPFTDADFDSTLPRRLLDFYDLVDGVTDELTRRGVTSTAGLKATSTKGHYGRYQRHVATGVDVQVNYSTWWWAHEYPSPMWLRLWKADPAVTQGWHALADAGQLAHVAGPSQDEFARVALRVPRGVESHVAVKDLADQVEVALTALPSTLDGRPDVEPPEEVIGG